MTARIDAYCSERHYFDTMMSTWCALPPDVRGTFYAINEGAKQARARGVEVVTQRPRGQAPLLVASHRDSNPYHRRPRIYMEHGCGQPGYPGCPDLAHSGSYSGGEDHHGTILFLCPSERVAGRWRGQYPTVPAAVVGTPRMDAWHTRPAHTKTDQVPVIAVSHHWDCDLCPEAGWAFPEFRDELIELSLARHWKVIGHGHPRVFDILLPFYEAYGIEPVREFEEVLERADCYVVDNSSTALDFASTGRPIVWMTPQSYRRDVYHGGRFWEWEKAGMVAEPGNLIETIDAALRDPIAVRLAREAVVKDVYAYTDGHATERAVKEILHVLAA